jgi:pilus assembly protein Flp/PilA
MTNLIKKLADDRKGATAIEYGLIAAFIALVLVAALPAARTNLKTTFTNINSGLTTANTQPTT